MRRRVVSARANIISIRKTGRGEGHLQPMPNKSLSPIGKAERQFRRKLKGIVGNPV